MTNIKKIADNLAYVRDYLNWMKADCHICQHHTFKEVSEDKKTGKLTERFLTIKHSHN